MTRSSTPTWYRFLLLFNKGQPTMFVLSQNLTLTKTSQLDGTKMMLRPTNWYVCLLFPISASPTIKNMCCLSQPFAKSACPTTPEWLNQPVFSPAHPMSKLANSAAQWCLYKLSLHHPTLHIPKSVSPTVKDTIIKNLSRAGSDSNAGTCSCLYCLRDSIRTTSNQTM